MIEKEQDQIPESRNEEKVFLEYENFGLEPTREEREITSRLFSILENTELPKFEVVEVTSTSNLKVKTKAEAIFEVIPEEKAIPEVYRGSGMLDFSEDNLLEAPWVNLIHGWTKVLNYMNTVSAIQEGEIDYDPQVIAAITRELYLLTTVSDPNPFFRTDERYLDGDFAETKMRKAGTKGANSQRHVSFKEMMLILNTVEERFRK
ncbi:MAG: hypothetical protein WCY37_03105 [Candidatus Dojkabacteria bacterium]|jgi:hypothetical protein